MVSNMTNQQIEDVKLALVLSGVVGEYCDIKDITKVSLFVWHISPKGQREELLQLLLPRDQTLREDSKSFDFHAVFECMKKLYLAQ